jgi:RNA polymerase sigma-70 factor (ECF subfamily)
MDATAFGAALAREAPILLAAARAIVLDEPEAEDLVQVTFEIALRSRTSLREPAALRAWLLRIETREAFRVRRRLSRLVRFEPTIHEIAVGPGATTESLAIRSALAKLPVRTRAVVVLHHMVGLSVSETAVAMGTSPNTVKTQLRDGLSRLRIALDDD